MILTHSADDGAERIYVTRFASVCCYIARPKQRGEDLKLTVEPGLFAYHAEFERNRHAVAAAALAEIAQRLVISPEEVLRQPFERLTAVADPDLPKEYRYARRSKNLARAYR